MRPLTLVLPFVLAASALACLNDRDTLARQAERMPDLVRTATGRFERNPPLYYRLRIERVERELAADPKRLPLYDDIAVAYDRIGDSDSALKWMARKRGQLDAQGGKITPKRGKAPLDPLSDAWYRYYANDGTFRVHRWIRGGAKAERLSEAVRARAEIDRALQINPDAHFGRERVQLAVMDWLIATTKGKTDDDLGSWLSRHPRLEEWTAKKTSEGLAGLVVLGNAWESPDAFGALAQLTQQNARMLDLGAFVDERRAELVSSGHAMRRPSFLLADPDPTTKKAMHREFERLRAEANEWHAKRERFMLARLQAGKHPDTDADFWDGYRESPAPKLNASIRAPSTGIGVTALLISYGAALLIGIAVLAYIVGCVRRRRFIVRRADLDRPRVP